MDFLTIVKTVPTREKNTSDHLVTLMALLIESASAEASLRSLLVEFPLASDLGKATVMINNDDISD
jgi:hypothetical protein